MNSTIHELQIFFQKSTPLPCICHFHGVWSAINVNNFICLFVDRLLFYDYIKWIFMKAFWLKKNAQSFQKDVHREFLWLDQYLVQRTALRWHYPGRLWLWLKTLSFRAASPRKPRKYGTCQSYSGFTSYSHRNSFFFFLFFF